MLKEQLLKIKEQLDFNNKGAEQSTAKKDIRNNDNSNQAKVKVKRRRSFQRPDSEGPLDSKTETSVNKSDLPSQNDEYHQRKKRFARNNLASSKKKKKHKKPKIQKEAPYFLISNLPLSKAKHAISRTEKSLPKYSIPQNIVTSRKGLWDFSKERENYTLELIPKSVELFPAKELVLGLDFGTAFTKVVIADETYAYPVKFEDSGYLLPSEVYIMGNGNFTLNKKESKRVFTELKHPLLFRNSVEDDDIVIVAFLSLVFKSARKWVATSSFRNHKIDWLINAGLATDSYHHLQLKNKFGNLVNLAWNVSYLTTVTPLLIQKLLLDQKRLTNELESLDLALPSDCLSVFPEYVAQISGYMNSPSKRDFSHLLIDVGAGTLDLVMFTTKNIDGEWRYSTNAKNISNLGSDILKAHRLQYVPERSTSIDTLLKNVDVASKLSISLEELNSFDSEFAREVNLRLRNVISKVAGGYKFGADITTFICGGGREIEFYQKQLEILKNYPIDRIDLPPPNRFQSPIDFDMEMFHRFSVALGLSYDPYNIGECEVNDVEAKAPVREYSPSEYILNLK